MGTKKPRHKKALNTSLNKEIAGALVSLIMEGGTLFTREEYATNGSRVLKLKEKDYVLTVEQYRYWMKARLIIPETRQSLHQQINEARHRRRMVKHEDEKKTLVLEAQIALRALQKLPLGTRTRRILKKSRMIIGEGKVQTHEEEEVIETPIDPRMVAAKQKGAEYVLSNLDPEYKKVEGGATVNVMVNLGDLRKEKAARDEAKAVPKEDYKVVKEEK